MLQKIKKIIQTQILAIASLPILLAPLAVGGAVATTLATGGTALADATCSSTGNVTCPSQAVCAGATNLQLGTGDSNSKGTTGADCTGNDQTSKVNNLIATVLNVFSVVVGVVAVIMIIYAGFKYISSGGKEESVKTAKSTILYAIIGLVIVALAQIIVKFVLSKAIQPGTSA